MRISEPQTGLQEIGYLRFYYDLFIIPFMVLDLSICRWFIIFYHVFIVSSLVYHFYIICLSFRLGFAVQRGSLLASSQSPDWLTCADLRRPLSWFKGLCFFLMPRPTRLA